MMKICYCYSVQLHLNIWTYVLRQKLAQTLEAAINMCMEEDANLTWLMLLLSR